MVPCFQPADSEREVNDFLARHRVVLVERRLIEDGPQSAWTVCVEYQPGPAPAAEGKLAGKKNKEGGIDYREVLPAGQFEIFSRLRDLRKSLADADAVPVYNIFTNAQLAAMATGGVDSRTKLLEIPGVGAAKVDKYGDAFLAALAGVQETTQ